MLCELVELVFDSAVLYYSLAGKIYITFEAWTADSKRQRIYYIISHILDGIIQSLFVQSVFLSSVCYCIFVFIII